MISISRMALSNNRVFPTLTVKHVKFVSSVFIVFDVLTLSEIFPPKISDNFKRFRTKKFGSWKSLGEPKKCDRSETNALKFEERKFFSGLGTEILFLVIFTLFIASIVAVNWYKKKLWRLLQVASHKFLSF